MSVSSAPPSPAKPPAIAPPFGVTLGPETQEEDFLTAVAQDPCTDWSRFTLFTNTKKVLYTTTPISEQDMEFTRFYLLCFQFHYTQVSYLLTSPPQTKRLAMEYF